ncbi:MAG: hypothetical protein AB7U82_27870 [Blastocatellales bacterium]
MTIHDQEIRSVVIGDDWPIERTYKGAPTGTNINKATLTIKENEGDADASAIAQIVITSAPSANGQITNTGAAGTVELKLTIPRADTTPMKARPYAYDIRLEHSSGAKGPREKGVVYPVAGVADA